MRIVDQFLKHSLVSNLPKQIDFRNSLQTVSQRSSKKNMPLNALQCSQENTYARVSVLIKLQATGLQLYLEEPLTSGFSREFCNFLSKLITISFDKKFDTDYYLKRNFT